MEPRIPSGPEDVLEAMDSAAGAVAALGNDMEDIPFGQIAAAGVNGFLVNLSRGWVLLAPNGARFSVMDIAEHVRIWAKEIPAPEETQCNSPGKEGNGADQYR